MKCEECGDAPATTWLFDEAVCEPCAEKLRQLDKATS